MLRHEDFKGILKNSEKVRVKNITIKSERHSLYTLEQNKVALSAFCNKRFYLDSIHSLPFGHKSIRDVAFQNIMINDWNWDIASDSTEGEDEEEERVPILLSDDNYYSPPDPGFSQRSYSSSELEDYNVDWNEPYCNSPPSLENPFIDHEAVESNTESITDSPIIGSKLVKSRKRILSYSDSDE